MIAMIIVTLVMTLNAFTHSSPAGDGSLKHLDDALYDADYDEVPSTPAPVHRRQKYGSGAGGPNCAHDSSDLCLHSRLRNILAARQNPQNANPRCFKPSGAGVCPLSGSIQRFVLINNPGSGYICEKMYLCACQDGLTGYNTRTECENECNVYPQ